MNIRLLVLLALLLPHLAHAKCFSRYVTYLSTSDDMSIGEVREIKSGNSPDNCRVLMSFRNTLDKEFKDERVEYIEGVGEVRMAATPRTIETWGNAENELCSSNIGSSHKVKVHSQCCDTPRCNLETKVWFAK